MFQPARYWPALLLRFLSDSIPSIVCCPRICSFFTLADQIQSVTAWLTLVCLSHAYCFSRSAVSGDNEILILCFILHTPCVYFTQPRLHQTEASHDPPQNGPCGRQSAASAAGMHRVGFFHTLRLSPSLHRRISCRFPPPHHW